MPSHEPVRRSGEPIDPSAGRAGKLDAALYYASCGTAELGEGFIAEFERSVNLLQSQPMLGAVWRTRFRRLPMRRFPYNIVYVVSEGRLRVLAVAHQRRRPGYWRARS